MTPSPTSIEARLFLNEAETARLLGVSSSTLARLARSGDAPVPPVVIGQRRMYSRRDLESLAGVTA